MYGVKNKMRQENVKHQASRVANTMVSQGILPKNLESWVMDEVYRENY